MRFTPTDLEGTYLVELEPIRDQRGFFARTFCRDSFRAQGLADEFVQSNIAWNQRKGTLRGLHYNQPPEAEAKLVRCTRGRLYDVALDLRQDSATFLHWSAFELSPENGRLLYVPPGIAHGYQALEDDTEVAYWMSSIYRPGAQTGVRWNDPAFGIHWPIASPLLSERDRSYPDFTIGASP